MCMDVFAANVASTALRLMRNALLREKNSRPPQKGSLPSQPSVTELSSIMQNHISISS